MNNLSFPEWNPRWQTVRNINSDNSKIRYKALRNSSSNFIAREDVRKYIKAKYQNRCCMCGRKENLQIDHIISVLEFAQKRFPYKNLNKEENLALLCRSCNATKEP